MIKAIIFDFDRCVFDTPSMGTEYLEPTLDILEESEVSEETKREFKQRMHETDFDEALTSLNIPEAVATAMRDSYAHTTPPQGVAYDDIDELANLHLQKILVSSGFRSFQEAKIEMAGVASYFDEIIIDAFDDPNPRKGKRLIFEELLAAHEWQSEEVIVVGDKPSSELGAGKSLGMVTVQIVRPGTLPWPDAMYHIRTFAELPIIIKSEDDHA